jgi:integrase
MMSLDEIIAEAGEKAAAGEDIETGLSYITTNRHFRFLKTLLDWVEKKGVKFPAGFDWEELIDRDLDDNEDGRPKYTVEQFRLMLQLPIWTGCLSVERRLEAGPNCYHDAAYWVPLLIWYGGGRRGEICKMLISEVRELEGIWYLWIDNSITGRVKNRSSRRAIPIHPELIRLGFLDYVRALEKRGDTLLFPELAGWVSPPGDIFYSRWWPKIRAHLPFVLPGQAIHSIRHAVNNELKDAEVFPEFREDLLGWSHPSQAKGRYANVARLQKLVQTVHQIPIVTDGLEARPIALIFKQGNLESGPPDRLHAKPRVALAQRPGGRAGRQEATPTASTEAPRVPTVALVWNKGGN